MSGGVIAAMIAAIAFAVLVVFLIIVLVRLSKVLNEVQTTVKTAEQSVKAVTTDVNALSNEMQELLVKTNALMLDINGKVETIDPVFKAAGDLGESLTDLNQGARQAVDHLAQTGVAGGKAGLSFKVLQTAFSLARKLSKKGR